MEATQMKRIFRRRFFGCQSHTRQSGRQNPKLMGIDCYSRSHIRNVWGCGRRAAIEESFLGRLSSRPRVAESDRGISARLPVLDYIEGQHIVIEYRFAEGNLDRLGELATELVHLKVDILAAESVQAALAAKERHQDDSRR